MIFFFYCGDMCKALNPKYTALSRSYLSGTLIPSWYGVEKANVISGMKDVPTQSTDEYR